MEALEVRKRQLRLSDPAAVGSDMGRIREQEPDCVGSDQDFILADGIVVGRELVGTRN